MYNLVNIPLLKRVHCMRQGLGVVLTFSLTFSNEEGETLEKQTRKTSVWG